MNKPKALPTVDQVRSIFDYNEATGQLFWKTPPARNVKVGDLAGSISGSGYMYVSIKKVAYRVHRIVWLYVTGEDPGSDLIDHIDGNKLNNKFANLRRADYSQNNWNSRLPQNNTSGRKGVSWNKRRRKWTAVIRKHGKLRHLGHFDCFEIAYVAYLQAAAELHGEFARTA